ncbi:hypothetical protein KCH_70530 [Kitasatospora cheerisanensis KCTC 2395]|uniref:Uncharacterized protein n=1 Tax=Kitasatospora cheerisanensis KCTC 2395 TaxID=1348663 RepID=A0A066YMR8_9ACTN|nr:hypothetical protein KCH_70530 [Kitasatospora cheerisanensis KCTC 2395]
MLSGALRVLVGRAHGQHRSPSVTALPRLSDNPVAPSANGFRTGVRGVGRLVGNFTFY